MYLHLSGLSGEEFDHEYMRGQVQDHQTAVELFATEADQPTSSVDHLAGELLPTLRQHLQMAQEISDIDGVTLRHPSRIPTPRDDMRFAQLVSAKV